MNPNYRADIDGLRGVAVALVLLYHFDFAMPGGFIGVDVFFVISGFLITSMLLRDGFTLVGFWERRCRRLLPALFLVVLVSLAASLVILEPVDLTYLGRLLLGQSLLASNFVLAATQFGYFGYHLEVQPLLHTWSLAVEEQFYLLFPLLLVKVPRRRLPGALLGLLILSLLLSVWQTAHFPVYAFYLLPARLWELLAGCLLPTLPGWKGPRPLREVMGFAGLALIFWGAFSFSKATPFPGSAALIPVLGTCLVIASGGRPSRCQSLLSWRPLVFVGLISYSLYLWHWPLLSFATYVSCSQLGRRARLLLLVTSLLLGAASWKWVERPCREKRVLGSPASLLVAAVCFLLPCGWAGGALLFGEGWPGRYSARARELIVGENPYRVGRSYSLEEVRKNQVVELGDASGEPIMVWGDSHAHVLCPMLDQLARQQRRRLYPMVHPATAPLLHYKAVSLALALSPQEIPEWGQSTLDFISRNRVQKVFLVALWTNYNFSASDLSDTFAAIRARGAEVYFMQSVPLPAFEIKRAILLHDLGLAPVPTGLPPGADHTRRPELERKLAKIPARDYHLLDPLPYLQDPATGGFPFFRDGKLLYWDAYHLSDAGANQLRPMFEEAFRK